MAFEITFPTRHTDSFAGTGYVHAGVLLALTEMAYAAFEQHCGIEKPGSVYAVQKRTEVDYLAPLPWQDGAVVRVRTVHAEATGFRQEIEIRSAANQQLIARIVHHWVWLDTSTSRPVHLSADDQRRLLEG